jgi:hypothetical protein
MEFVVQRTDAFTKDLKRLARADQARIEASVARIAQLFVSDKPSFYKRVSRPLVPILRGGFQSSLYVTRAGPKLRVILAADDDPLFGRSIITLIAVARHEDLRRLFERAAKWLYSNQLEDMGESQGEDFESHS